MAVKPALREQLDGEIMRRGDVSTRDMFGTTAYMVKNRMFAFWVADGLVAKLPDHTRQDFIDRKQGVSFQGPQGRGFGDWTRLHVEKKDDVAAAKVAVDEAYEYVKGGAGGVERARKKRAKK
jgi:hypothetical protein